MLLSKIEFTQWRQPRQQKRHKSAILPQLLLISQSDWLICPCSWESTQRFLRQCVTQWLFSALKNILFDVDIVVKFVVDSLSCTSRVHNIFTAVMTQILEDKSTGNANHIRFVKFHEQKTILPCSLRLHVRFSFWRVFQGFWRTRGHWQNIEGFKGIWAYL